MTLLPHVEFARSGWRQLSGMNRSLGVNFVRGLILQREVAAYIAAHEESGIILDTVCQELRYEGGIYMLLMRHQGIWYITDIWTTDTPVRFFPAYLWQLVRCGWRYVVAKVLIGWRNLSECCALESRSSYETVGIYA